jgi:predicted acyltransferase
MQRLRSLDVFRGMTIAGMILVNNPGSWSHVYAPLKHAEWHGWTPTDMVFPFFLWISGLAMTLSFAKRKREGADKTQLLVHALRRGALIVLIGLALNFFGKPDLATFRIPGVLPRIGVCYAAATALAIYLSRTGLTIAGAALLVIYTGAMLSWPSPDPWSIESNFARYVDGQLLAGHMWSQTKDWDPEGVVSTLPAIVSVLLGVLAGALLERRDARAFGVWGAGLVTAGYALSPWIPFNKALWTPSYTLLMAGLACAFFGLVYWLVEGGRWKRGTRFFEIYGTNAIVSFVASGILARALAKVKPQIFEALTGIASPVNASLIYALLNVAAIFALAWLLWRKKILVRL